MATAAQIRASAKYDKENTRSVILKLNLTNDADILKKLDSVPNRQGYIKDLIRLNMRGRSGVLTMEDIAMLILPVAKKYLFDKVYIFGSYSRKEATEDSDIDLMIEGGSFKGINGYLEAKEALERSTGKSVDIVFSDVVYRDNSRAGKRFRDHIERDKVLIYG